MIHRLTLSKYTILSILLFLCATCQKSSISSTFNPTQYVDPFIGTGFHGHTFPGPLMPFGMVQLSPDTRLPGWDASSGYHFSDSTIYGFSHTHLSGTGIGDMGDILILPFTGAEKDTLIARFNKKNEQASVGYYSVLLDNYGVKAELTATTRTGMHRYTYQEGQEQKVLIDLAHVLQANWGHKSILGEIEWINSTSLQGKRISSGWAHDHPVYFYAELSSPYKVLKTSGAEVKQAARIRGKELKAWLSFPENTTNEVLVKIGISSVSVEGARKNLVAENPAWDFDQVKTNAADAWLKALRKIQIKTKDEAVLKNFYTALYHCMVAPMIAQDVDGQYRGMDKKIHQAEAGFVNYSVFSMWDTFRALHPLMTIIDEKSTNAWIQALLRKYEEGGVLPKWALASNYTGTMVGYPAVSIIADALMKGIDDFDIDLALEAAVISSEYHPERIAKIKEPRAERLMPKHLDFIERMEFIPADSVNVSVSYGLECAYYDWCIAQIAQKAGNTKLAQKYMDRSTYYQYYFDTEINFMRGKLASGQWQEPFSPFYSDHENSPFVEGNSWQWMWFVPHDIAGYVALMGGKKQFENKLDALFSSSSELEGENVSADITGLIGQYAHGNEPSHHVSYLYNFVDQPMKTQAKVDEILQTLYQPNPAGISGNEDCGAMSAWYVLNALGFYQVCPGDPTWSIGRPLIDEAILQLENGETFQITVENNSPANKYVEKVHLNGEPIQSFSFPHAAIKSGGTLKFWMKE